MSNELHPRAAKYRAEQLRDLLSQLRLAQMTASRLGVPLDGIAEIITDNHIELERLLNKAGERIESRKRPKIVINDHLPQEEYVLYLDECGSHDMAVQATSFPVFCLCGAIIRKEDYQQIDAEWKAWKATNLGGPEVIVHEPDVRTRNRRFRGESREHGNHIVRSMEQFISTLDVHYVAAVVDLRAFETMYPKSQVDDFLPKSCYLMAIDFVMERFLHFVQGRGHQARGLVIAESRGVREDAQVHAEFIRLHLEGTQFIPESAFRAVLRPYIEFYRKKHNNTGLQIADLAARPFAEKVLNTSASPDRWDLFAPRLYDGLCESPHKYGLKVFPLSPANDPFPGHPRKAKEGAVAPSVTD